MPMHDWSKVDAGTYHDFHQDWTIELKRQLNRGILPPGFIAMADQKVQGPEPDVVALKRRGTTPFSTAGGTAVLPVARGKTRLNSSIYAVKANRIVVKHRLGQVVAAIEIISPGNKDRRHSVASFRDKMADFVRKDINVLVVDPFPPGPHDPEGMSEEVWDEIGGDPLPTFPAEEPLRAIAVEAGDDVTAYTEAFAVGGEIPVMPLYLAPEWFVDAPLEASYAASWAVLPDAIKEMVLESNLTTKEEKEDKRQ